MQMPALLPKELQIYDQVPTEEKLYDLLIQKSAPLLLFFEAACDDETWSVEHGKFMAKIIQWLTQQILDDRFAKDFCSRIASSLRKHHEVLNEFIPKNIVLALKDAQLAVNSLLLSTLSEYFKEELFRQCGGKKGNVFALAAITRDDFEPFFGYMNTGVVPGLWKLGQKELFLLLKQASIWEIKGVSDVCQEMLHKYLTVESVVQTLILSHTRGWLILKQSSMDYINGLKWGIVLSASAPNRLCIEFLNFSAEILENFEPFKTLVTDIICSGIWVDAPIFEQVMEMCPNLQLLDLTGMPVFSQYFSSIPATLKALYLSQCLWLTAENLRQFVEWCPAINELHLSSNDQLNFSAWGELLKFKQLSMLVVSHCTQIKDEDLKVIIAACEKLIWLDLAECDRIGESGFLEIAKGLPHLMTLNLSHCNISDNALVDIAARCQVLQTLDLSRCEQITEKGVLALVKHSRTLRELDLRHCALASVTFEMVKKLNPLLILKS